MCAPPIVATNFDWLCNRLASYLLGLRALYRDCSMLAYTDWLSLTRASCWLGWMDGALYGSGLLLAFGERLSSD